VKLLGSITIGPLQARHRVVVTDVVIENSNSLPYLSIRNSNGVVVFAEGPRSALHEHERDPISLIVKS